jgi:hypothetical protein
MILNRLTRTRECHSGKAKQGEGGEVHARFEKDSKEGSRPFLFGAEAYTAQRDRTAIRTAIVSLVTSTRG